MCYKTDGLHLYGCLPGIAHLPQQLVQVWNVRGPVAGGRWPFNFHAFWIALILVCCFTLNFIPSTPQLSSVLGMMFVVSLEDCRHVAWIQTHIVTQGKTYHHHPKYLEPSPSWVGKKLLHWWNYTPSLNGSFPSSTSWYQYGPVSSIVHRGEVLWFMPASCKHLGIFDNWCCRTRKPYVQSNCIITEGRMYTHPNTLFCIQRAWPPYKISIARRGEVIIIHGSSIVFFFSWFFDDGLISWPKETKKLLWL